LIPREGKRQRTCGIRSPLPLPNPGKKGEILARVLVDGLGFAKTFFWILPRNTPSACGYP